MSEIPSLSDEQKEGLFFATGSTHPRLAEDVAAMMQLDVGAVERKTFPNSELYVRYEESVRSKDVIIMQSYAARPDWSINDALQELILLSDAARGASAREVTAVIPHFPYARQDRKVRGREPVSAASVIRQLAGAGVSRIVSVDLHSPQTQAVFAGPFDHLTAEPILAQEIKNRVAQDAADSIIVAPDTGRAKSAEQYARKLGLNAITMVKSRDKTDPEQINHEQKPKGVRAKTCYLVDDMIDTAGTLVSAARELYDAGASKIITAATHGLFSPPAIKRLWDAPINEIIVTDTVPMHQTQEDLGGLLKVKSVAPLLSHALLEIVTGGSVSKIFKDQNYH